MTIHSRVAGKPKARRIWAGSSGIVASIGDMAERPARLYARLTGRDHVPIADAEPASVPRAAEIVVASPDSLTYRLLEHLYDPGRAAAAPGLILGVGEDELRRNVLIRSAGALLGSGPLGRIVHYESRLAGEAASPDGRILLGREAADGRLKSAMSDGSDLLILSTHSDGLDAPVGRKVICPLVRRREEHPGVNRPTCLSTGHCHRLHVPLGEALDSGRLIPPETIRSRVVLLRTCFGLLPKGALNDYRYGLLRGIAANPGVGAIIASWNVTFADPQATEPLVEALRAGARLGEAVAEFNRSPAACRTGDRLCLIGDPRLRFEGTARGRTAATGGRSPPGPGGREGPPPATPRARAAFLRAYLDWSAGFQPASARPALEKAADKVAAMLRRSADAAAVRARDEIVAAIAGGVTLSCKIWCGHAQAEGTNRAAADCPSCRETAARIDFKLDLAGGMRRRLINCPRCGIVEDSESDAPSLRLRLRDRVSASFFPGAEHRPWRAALRIEHVGGIEPPILYKSGDGGHAAEERFVLPRPLDASAIFLTLFLVDGVRLSVARIPSGTNKPSAAGS